MSGAPHRLAVVVSHPIQYFAPLHQRLAQRDDIEFKVFFTWHSGKEPIHDRGFAQNLAWDLPLTSGYCHELVPNTAADPGTHRFVGLRNPSLIDRVTAWRPDTVIVHGWAWRSHLRALRDLPARGICTLLRGDSHLLNEARRGLRWRAKQALLTRIFRWPNGFLVTGAANRAYYETFGVPAARLHLCPHSIDVARFAEPAAALEAEAERWRHELGIADDRVVVLYAGKFEPGKRPVELARAVLALDRLDVMVLFAGGGELQGDIETIAAAHPDRVRVLPFQNQTRMPVVYRLGDVFVLPSAGESWGLAVNEALAASRPVLVSDRVGCATDVVTPDCGRVFTVDDLSALRRALDEMTGDRARLAARRRAAAEQGRRFDIAATEAALMTVICRAPAIRQKMPLPAQGAF
ncbi:MAG: glycosyltransferase family 4 protein [Stellaceae bacterium]